MSSSKHRGWCFTLNNYSESDVNSLQIVTEMDTVKYSVYGFEVGESGTPHIQGYIEFANPRVFNGVKKLLGSSYHIEPRKGSPKQASDYCKKEGNFTEKGTLPQQGQRSDLDSVKDSLISGETSIDEILLTKPITFHQYGRTLERIEDLRFNSNVRSTTTRGVWYWGSTGVGKSHKAFENFTLETHYVHPPHDKGWWDGYKQQKIVVINDFRGEIPYNELLNLVDKWPHKVPRRNRQPINFTSELVIITSSLPPWEVYNRRAEEDSIDQLLRRFEVYRLDTTNHQESTTLSPSGKEEPTIEQKLEQK